MPKEQSSTVIKALRILECFIVRGVMAQKRLGNTYLGKILLT